MASSLIPEKPLLVYPSLASTLGLEESVMLSGLADRVSQVRGEEKQNFIWYRLSVVLLLQLFPFWSRRDLQRVCTSLRETGVLIVSSPPLENASELRFAFNEKVEQRIPSKPAPTHRQQSAQQSTNSRPESHQEQQRAQSKQAQHVLNTSRPNSSYEQQGFLSKNYIASNWQPDHTTLAQLAQHGITEHFAFQQVPEFIAYWHGRGEAHHSWGSKFLKHAVRKWHDAQTKQAQKAQESVMSAGWTPSLDAYEILVDKAGITREFIEDAIPEFILYWSERGERHRTWNTKFVQHVQLQWAKYTAAIEHNTSPRPIPEGWQPSSDVFDVLQLANIDLAFAQSLTAEFVLYWRDRGTLHGSWKTKYLQYVKYRWAQRHNQQHANPANNNQLNRQTRDISLEEELSDRSWAN